ncbi:nephrin-like isoform X2 [Bradysia coprophila]|uniref:nephrin-like isoform X2 n=1 Tax=Bradysia coprophila TaxID=38358 RepID=UPI00187D9930|nr:nephrin-like isoform X2 [Bradysia coprophila]
MNYRCSIICVLIRLFIVVISFFGFGTASIEGENVPINFIEAVQGTTARIPCDVTPPIDDDKITLVIWYKDGLTTPIYSFDARDFKIETGSHWSDETILNGRGFFQLKANPATFAIEAVKNSDTGIYRCRVDFQKNPTRNSKFNLTVIIPPENILILDDKGAHIPHYILGPYNEGANVELTCVATGGRPQPNLTWWRGENHLLDDSYTVTNEKKVKNVLLLEKLQRQHLHAVLACQASNNNVTTPIRSAVTLNMNLRPLWVKLQGENKPLSAGTEHELLCEVVGSRPAPTITWWKGSILMRNSTDTTSQDANTTISMLKFTPTIDDSGKYLSCRGEQPLIPDSGLESGWKLDIHHVPVVSLELGSNLNSTTIREGADVYFECNIKSNPWVYKVNWNHNGKPLYNNVLAGIIVANQSLVLQNVTRARSGSYTCIGINNEGDGESNTVLLDIKYAPLCRPGQIQVYNIARHETAKIVCELESNPSHDVNFTWKFNTSIAETTDLPASLIAIERSKSVAHYTPTNEQDYGTLLCWGTNDIGTQSEPCIFNVNPAGKPDALSNCTISNQTLNVLQLECLEGFDGGLPQLFEVEVFYARTKNLVLNQSSKQPFFELKGLRSDYGYDIVLTAKNAKGKSAETILHMYTLNGAEKHTDEFPSLDFLLPYTGNSLQTKLLLGAVAGLVFGILLILIASMVILRLKRKRVGNGAPDNGQTDTSGATEQSCEATLRGGLSGSVDSLEKNPDIIPQGQEDCVFDDDSKLHWNHPRTYATVALAGQYSSKPNIHPNYQTCQYTIPENFEVDNYQSQQSQQAHPDQMQYATYTNADNQTNKELTYAELSLVIPKQKAIYTSATLGRPRNKDVRVNEPTIYAQIDLAHDGPQNGYSPVTWIPAQHLKTMQNHHHQQQHQDQRMAPIVCSKESPITLKLSAENYAHHNSPMSPQQILNHQQQQHQQQQQPHHPSMQLADPGNTAAVPRF